MSEPAPYRLPRTATPAHYRLTLRPDLAAARFDGTVEIDLTVHEATDTFVCNAAELELHRIVVHLDDRSLAASATVDEELGRATIHLGETVAPGAARLEIAFGGILNDKLRGFYRSTFTDDDGVEHVIATTQMQSTDARRAFPCWDEPDLKASFGVTLIVDPDQLAIANTAEIRREPLDDGMVAITFADTMVMSSYLVAFVVGPLVATDPIDVGGVPLRVVHRPGRDHQTGFALEVAAAALRYFEDYYGIAYPGDKVDLVAIPDFAFGAMENLGCVVFREVLLLADPAEVTQAELQNVADVINHELAHMWFGDLVTMKWWNGIWLNEAFATFMEMKATDAFRPEWRRWADFGLSRSAAFETDALEATRPIEIDVGWPHEAEAMFDILTYEKGAALVRMLEQYLGEEPFRDGIRHYLTRHAYANTETHDLWDAIEETTGQPVRAMMDTWIYQGGYPVLSLDREAGRIRQRRFRADGTPDPASWVVPVRMSTADGEARTLVSDVSEALPDDIAPDEVASLNRRASGFYRVRLPDETLAAIGRNGPGSLDEVERYSLLDDTWALVVAGDVAATAFVELIDGFAGDDDPTVWRRITAALGSLVDLLDGAPRANFEARIRALVRPELDRVGWEADGAEEGGVRIRRGTLFAALGIAGADDEVRERARAVQALTEPEPELLAAAVRVIAHTGTDAELDDFIGRFRAATSPQAEQRYLYNLAWFPEAHQLDRVLELALSDDVRSQNVPYLLRNTLLHPTLGERAWDFVTERWEPLTERLPSVTIVRMLDGVRGLDRPALRDQVHAFVASHPIPQGGQTVDQILERLSVQTAFREREASRLSEAFA